MRLQELTPTKLTERHDLLGHYIEWQDDTADNYQLCSIEGLPWLGLTQSQDHVSHIIGFSTDTQYEQPFYPPQNAKDAAQRVGSKVMSFNSDPCSRGIGELFVNDPVHMQPGSVSGRIAVRSIAVDTRPNARIISVDQEKSDRALFLRHGALTLASAALNLLTDTAGTEAAARLMELRYRRAPLVRMPIPPIWRHQQKKQDSLATVIDDPGEIMLVRGRKYRNDNVMAYAGSFRAG